MEVVNPFFTVLTPTFKGADRLAGVLKCLLDQSFKSFEWIIVLDGHHQETIHWINDNIYKNLMIDFIVKVDIIQHNHKKAAINHGLKMASGEFIIIADDDDWFPSNSFETFIKAWNSIPNENRVDFVGVTGLCVDESGNVIGDKFPKDEFVSTPLECLIKHRIKGEKWGIIKKSIFLENMFFEEPKGYVGESTVWFNIGKKYKTLYINKVVRIYRFNPISIMNSVHSKQKILANCQAYSWGYKHPCENFLFEIIKSPRILIAYSSNYVRYLLHCLNSGQYRYWLSPVSSISVFISAFIGLPIGFFLFSRDLIRK
ncbi:MAG: glycosyltransferase family 2 protein [Chitinophagaceae bacterium]